MAPRIRGTRLATGRRRWRVACTIRDADGVGMASRCENTPLLDHFHTKTDHFAKTDSGQPQGKLKSYEVLVKINETVWCKSTNLSSFIDLANPNLTIVS